MRWLRSRDPGQRSGKRDPSCRSFRKITAMSLPNTESPTAEDVIDQRRAPESINKRFVGWCIYLVILCSAFALPLPEAAVEFLENALKEASAEVANWLFFISGTPALRTRTVFQLPGISIMVAKECSGIRSSLVLVITSLLAANMFLRNTWRRALLVGAVVPLGLLRNGFRILVISLLCVHIGPEMINSPIHRRGGPVFFVASFVPLFVVLWWLRRREVAAQRQRAPENPKSLPADVPIV